MGHRIYDMRYYLVCSPEYPKWIRDGEVRDMVKELFKERLAAITWGVIQMEIAGNHVHIFANIPPRFSIGKIVRVLKNVGAKKIF